MEQLPSPASGILGTAGKIFTPSTETVTCRFCVRHRGGDGDVAVGGADEVPVQLTV